MRLILESYIEMTLSSVINLFNLNYEKLGDQVSSILSAIIGAIVFFMPIIMIIFIMTKGKQAKDEIVEAKYGSLYEGLRTKRTIYLMCNFFFVIRRLVLIFAAVSLSNNPEFQCMVYIYTSQLSIMYILLYRPYEEPATNKTEIFNECCVLMAGYLLFIFTDFVP